MRDNFEVRSYDGAGRLGKLEVPRSDVTVETPALLPVVNPHVQTISPAQLEDEFGAEILITNSYIIYGSDELREPAVEDGLHDLLDFSGAVMTDSGSFQLAEYGDIDVTTEEILQFQHEIGSDIGTPVDIPTPPDVPHEQAVEEWETTRDRLDVAESVDTGEMLVTAPVQGSTYPDLRERAAREAAETELDLFPIGAVVPLMNEYRYGDLVDVVAAAKRGLPESAPVHLFGAGHPMMFALAAALGCDLFDSAAYALYARDDRYLTVRGTQHLDELEYFPCECSVCSAHTPTEVEQMGEDDRHRLLAEHNLAVSFGEIRRVKQAIHSGTLFELVETRARGHPTLVDGYRTLLDYADQLEATDPVAKDSFFYLSADSARRPEVSRHHERLDRLDVPGELLLTTGEHSDRYEESWRLVPPFGPVPRCLSDVYPLTAGRPERLDRAAYEAAAEGVARLVEGNPGTEFTVVHDGWPEDALGVIPDQVTVHGYEPKGRTDESGSTPAEDCNR
jgi:7-cyano-7-deazaguanine tRNA-ribosyltransferase